MYNIRFPDDKLFTGEYLSVTFKDGEGQTDSNYLAERFARKGLEVEKEPEPEKEPPELSEEEKAVLTEKAGALGLDLPAGLSFEEVKAAVATAEKAQKKAAAAAKKAAAKSAGDPDAKDSD